MARSTLTVTVRDVERIKGTGGDDVVTIMSPTAGTSVHLAGGEDRLVLAAGGTNIISASMVETITGGAGADTVTIELVRKGVVIDLGTNQDKVVLATAPDRDVSATLSNVETIIGGAAAETVILRTAATANMMVDLGGGADRIELSDVANVLVVSNVEVVRGGAAADRITATGTQATTLMGMGGNDTLIGGSGNDTLQGGTGINSMTGGAGADQFRFAAIADSAMATPDIVTDFAAGADLLVFTGLLQGSFAWRGSGTFTGTGNSEARFNPGGSVVQVDVNGDGTGDMAIQLSGTNLAGLSGANFLWL